MKRLIGLSLALAMIGSVGFLAAADEAVVDGHRWVTVQNPDGVKNGNGFNSFGDTCSLQEGQTIQKVAVKGDQLLAVYHPQEQGYGAQCGRGTLFFVSRVDFNGMTSKYAAKVAQRKRAKDEIRSLIKG